MRMHKLFLASMLTVTFGCPGDDTGTTDTEAATSSPTTSGETPTTSGETPTTTGEGNTTDGGMETSSGGMADSTSSGGMAESSSSGGGSESSGGVSEACMTFCADYFAVCGDSPANDYGDEGGCENACAGYDQKVLDCKVYHASMADGPKSVHCSHANIDGGGVC